MVRDQLLWRQKEEGEGKRERGEESGRGREDVLCVTVQGIVPPAH